MSWLQAAKKFKYELSYKHFDVLRKCRSPANIILLGTCAVSWLLQSSFRQLQKAFSKSHYFLLMIINLYLISIVILVEALAVGSGSWLQVQTK